MWIGPLVVNERQGRCRLALRDRVRAVVLAYETAVVVSAQ